MAAASAIFSPKCYRRGRAAEAGARRPGARQRSGVPDERRLLAGDQGAVMQLNVPHLETLRELPRTRIP